MCHNPHVVMHTLHDMCAPANQVFLSKHHAKIYLLTYMHTCQMPATKMKCFTFSHPKEKIYKQEHAKLDSHCIVQWKQGHL